MQVFCIDCKYVKEENSRVYCNHKNNIKVDITKSIHTSKEFINSLFDINNKNDCKWYERNGGHFGQSKN